MSIFKKIFNKPEEKSKPEIIIAMVLLTDTSLFSDELFLNDIENFYDDIKDKEIKDESVTFSIDDESVNVFKIDAPVPSGDIEGTADYAYNWRTAVVDLKDHKAHIIIAISNGSRDFLKRFKIQTQVICSILRTTNAIGVYLGNQSLLIPKAHYLSQAQIIDENDLPLNLWVYFGFRSNGEKVNGYTYGLKAFGKDEIEVINSDCKMSELRTFLVNIASYVLLYDVTLKDGQTIGFTEDQKLLITYSKGNLVDGMSFKIRY